MRKLLLYILLLMQVTLCAQQYYFYGDQMVYAGASNYFIPEVLSAPVNPYLGAEMISNGEFASTTGWTEGNPWTISGGVATFDDSESGNLTQANGDMISSIAALSNYQIQFDLTFGTATSVSLSIRNGIESVIYISRTYTGSGTITITEQFTTPGYGANAGIAFAGSSGSDGTFSIDNVSLKPTTYTPEYHAVLAEMTTSPSLPVILIQERAMGRLDNNGFLDRMDYMNIYMTDVNSDGEALINWVSPSSSATEVNSPTWVPFFGYSGDGTSAYINTGFNPYADGSNYTTNSASFGFYLLEDIQEEAYVVGSDDGNQIAAVAPNWSDGNYYARINNNFNFISASSSGSSGFWSVSRHSASDWELYKNGASLGSDTETATSAPNNDFYIGVRNTSGGWGYSANSFALFYAMDGTTDTENDSLDAIFSDLVADMKALIGSPPADLFDGNTEGWYMAQDEYITEATGVLNWMDASGNDHDLWQGTSDYQPIFSGDSVSFDGLNDVMRDTFTLVQPVTEYVVFAITDQISTEVITDGAANRMSFEERSIGPYVRLYAGAVLGASDGEVTNNTWTVAGYTFNGASSVIQINDNTEHDGDAGTGNGGGLSLGAYWFSNTQNNEVRFKEIIVRNVADDDATRDAIISYLMTKYGL